MCMVKGGCIIFPYLSNTSGKEVTEPVWKVRKEAWRKEERGEEGTRKEEEREREGKGKER